jgi:deazaflavin-dependent oxidoreductase (nitroreductase family)
MNGPTQPHRRTIDLAVVPVGPSLFVRLVMGPITKILNPIVATLAGRRHLPMAAQIRHVGRRTGTPHVTSVGARVQGAAVLIPLTFGNRSDWTRNVCAAGQCSVRLNGKVYQAVAPQFIDAAHAAPLIRGAFGPVQRLAFRLLGIQQFLQLQLATS